jgi:hypothetical protein
MSGVSKPDGRLHWVGLASKMAVLIWATWLMATSAANMSEPISQRALDATPTSCVQLVINPSFETAEAWMITDTTYWAAYSTDYASTGVRSMQTGIPPGSVNVRSYSSVRQPITIPAGAVSATLHIWYLPLSQEGILDPDGQSFPLLDHQPDGQPLANDRQYVLILNEQFRILEWLMWGRRSARHWSEATYDISQYIGQTIVPHIGTYNNGQDGVTTMYVDDVSMVVCYPTGVRRHWLPLVTVQQPSAAEPYIPTLIPNPTSHPS